MCLCVLGELESSRAMYMLIELRGLLGSYYVMLGGADMNDFLQCSV